MDKSMLEKLTLTTSELRAERQRIDEEERGKEAIRDMLAGMLPWETRDRNMTFWWKSAKRLFSS
jgi:hypothetical protein